jgi:hypothetical protein
MGLRQHPAQKNREKSGFFRVFGFTSPEASLMIEIDSGGIAGAACDW